MTDRPGGATPPAGRRPADRLHLSSRHRAQLEALLREHLPGVEVWACGSRITGESHDGSDLDLVLRAPGLQKIPTGRLSDLWEALRESTIPFLVEARDWARLPEGFHGEIERDYVVLVAGAKVKAIQTRTESSLETKSVPSVENLVGCIPAGWDYTTLGSACERSGGNIRTGPFGSQLHASDYVAVGIPSIMPQDIDDNRIKDDKIAKVNPKDAERLRKYRVQNGDIVYSRRGDVERRALVREHQNGWLCGTGCLRIRFGAGHVDPLYASFYLGHSNVREWIVRHAHGATMPNLNTSILSACPFVVPPLSEQRAIARVLGALDDKIELNRRMNETLEAMARALFRSWFVDFDPVRARMDGRDTGLPKEIADLFPDRLVDSPIGWTPEGWAVAPLTELMEVNPKRSLPRGQVAPYLDMANMPTRGHVPDSVVDRPVGSGTRFTNGDTLVARITPCLENGKTAYVDFLLASEIGWGSTEYIVLKPRRPLPGEFAYCLARSARFREFAIRNMSGTSGRQRVPAAALSGFGMSSPSAGAVAEFGRLVRPLFGRASRAARESRRLARLRDALLPELVSGALRVDRTAPPVRCA